MGDTDMTVYLNDHALNFTWAVLTGVIITYVVKCLAILTRAGVNLIGYQRFIKIKYGAFIVI